jgi:hypothetical protein
VCGVSGGDGSITDVRSRNVRREDCASSVHCLPSALDAAPVIFRKPASGLRREGRISKRRANAPIAANPHDQAVPFARNT